MEKLEFPEKFFWGTATSAYQIEGAALEDDRGQSIWDRFSHTPGKIKDNSSADTACDHYHRYLEDIKLMKKLGVNAYRFSISWPRILPTGYDKVNQKGLDFYDKLTDSLLEAGITPFATLYHWDLPQNLEDKGGWTSRLTSFYFSNYTDIVTRRLGDRIKHWITLNEPWCSSMLGYYEGVHAPGRYDLRKALSASHHLLLAHGLVLSTISSNSPGSEAGIVLNLSPVYPSTPLLKDAKAAKNFDGYLNRWFLDPLYKGIYPDDMLELYQDFFCCVNPSDLKIISKNTEHCPAFLGVNYYTPAWVKYSEEHPPLHFSIETPKWLPKTSYGWAVYPRGLKEVLERLKGFDIKKIYITENGVALDDKLVKGKISDTKRIEFIASHLDQLSQAIKEGSPVAGYFLWSLMDNFEWSEGYTKRFGITYTDYKTQKRTIKQSGRYYKEIIKKLNNVKLGSFW